MEKRTFEASAVAIADHIGVVFLMFYLIVAHALSPLESMRS
jgi:hypothetical protein